MGPNTSRSIIGRYYKTLASIALASWVFRICHYNPNSDQNSEEYLQAGMTPQFQPWRGKRDAKGIDFNSIIVVNDKYEATLTDTVDNFRYDKTGQLQTRINGFAQRAVTHWSMLFTDLIKLAGSTPGLDGANFYSAAHHGSQKNDLTSADNSVFEVVNRVNPTAVELADIVGEMIAHHMGFLDDQDEPVNENCRSYVLMVPMNMFRVATVVATKAVISDSSGAKDNPFIDSGFTLEIVPNPRLTAAADKYTLHLFSTDGDTRSGILQERGGVVLSSKAEGSDFEHDHDMWEFGAKANRGLGLYDWENSVRATLSTAA
jgi:hypothetical protein